MEVLQEEYKDTKIGRIPKDWEVYNLIDLTKDGISNGVFNDPKKVGSGYKLINVVNMYKGSSIRICDLTLLDLDTKEFTKNEVSYGDILFTRSSLVESGIAYSNINLSNDTDITYDGHLMKISPNTDISDPIFLSYFFRGNISRKQFIARGKTTTMTTIGQKDIANVKVIIPPLPEQQKIAEILSTVDEQISTTQAIIDKSKELKKGLMQKLFSEGIGHTEFKDSKIGRIPKDWEVKKVGDICKLQGGFAFKSKDATEEGVRWFKIANVGINRVKWNDASFLPIGFDDKHPDFLLNEGDIVVAMTRPVLNGKLKVCRILKNDSGALLNQRVGRVKLVDGDEADFYYQCFNTKRFINSVEGELFGTDPPNISSKLFENISIPVPPKEEKLKIANIFSEVDAKIAKEEQEKTQLEQLKKGLMQQLLTGQKRVQV